MKKVIFYIFLSFNLIRIGNCQTDGFDFRQAKWGMSKDDVIKSEIGNSYTIKESESSIEIAFKKIKLIDVSGYSDVFYYLKNNCLTEVLMVIYLNNSNNEFNCNNPLPLSNRISLVQKNYFGKISKRGFTPQFGWELETDRLFQDNETFLNYLLDPQKISSAYENLNEFNRSNYLKRPFGDLRFTFKSSRSTYLFKFYNWNKKPNSTSDLPCDFKGYSQIVAISANPTSSVIESVMKPDF
jgi:hypothetical protein